jgi:hypothetical protein
MFSKFWSFQLLLCPFHGPIVKSAKLLNFKNKIGNATANEQGLFSHWGKQILKSVNKYWLSLTLTGIRFLYSHTKILSLIHLKKGVDSFTCDIDY